MRQEILKNRICAIPENLQRTRAPHAARLVSTILHGFPVTKRDSVLVNDAVLVNNPALVDEPHRADGLAVFPEGKLETLGSFTYRFRHLARLDELGCSWNLSSR